MATIVLGAVGAYFGGNLGYMIGSAIGSYIDQSQIPATQVQGPRLGDLKVQTSNYGKPVASIHGATRVAGNLIWSTNLIETAHEQSQGGKGGGPQTNTTTYTYSQSFAIALCEGTIAGVGRIWANGKLIYNVTASADPATVAASQAMAASIRFYTGSETQTPDSLIQAYIGASNTPAYRGTAYVVFENMQLADYGNRMPNMEFEVIEVGTWTSTLSLDHSATFANTYSNDCVIVGQYAYSLDANWAYIRVFQISNPAAITLAASIPVAAGANNIAASDAGDMLYVACGSGLQLYSIANPALPTFVSQMAYSGVAPRCLTYNNGRVYLSNAVSPYNLYIFNVTNSLAPQLSAITPSLNYPYGITISGTLMCVATIFNGMQIFDVSNPDHPVLRSTTYTAMNFPIKIVVFGTTAFVVNSGSSSQELSAFNISNPSSPVYLGSVAGSSLNASDMIIVNGFGFVSHYGGPGYPSVDVFDLSNPSAMAMVATITAVNSTTIKLSGYSFILFRQSPAPDSVAVLSFKRTLSSVAPVLSSVVSSVCTKAGLTVGQIDVAQLTDTLDGYVTQRSSARAMIEQLMQAFYFDAVESDGKVKFVKRGGATALTIVEDDLAAYIHGGAMPDNLQIDRKQEMELPVEVNVQYLDEASSYQINSQRSQRLTTNSVNRLSINFALSLTASKAKQISDVLMYDAWTARMSFALHNSWKYSYLEPTDVIGVVKTGRTYNVRLIDEDASGGVYTRGAVLEDSAVYTQTANAAAPVTPGITVKGAATINLMLLDIPLLRDQDDAIGFYMAACTYSGTWQGEQTFKSNDSGASWTQSGQGILNQATIGAATSVLGDFTGHGNIFDEGNSVTVVLAYGTLASDTELNVLNGSNVILIGSEIIQFKNAALIATNTYTLTGLLRGRRGTEWAMASHAIGDRAVLLSSTTTYLFSNSSSEYNLARKYKGVSIGGFLADAVTQTFTNTAVAQECYSPVQLGGGRNAANDVLLTWIRRTRIGGSWNDYADVPLGEAAELYTVEIYSSNTYATLKRTITGITSPTTTYTAAQQTADGLTPGNPVYFIVYQVSATVGTGYGARGVV